MSQASGPRSCGKNRNGSRVSLRQMRNSFRIVSVCRGSAPIVNQMAANMNARIRKGSWRIVHNRSGRMGDAGNSASMKEMPALPDEYVAAYAYQEGRRHAPRREPC